MAVGGKGNQRKKQCCLRLQTQVSVCFTMSGLSSLLSVKAQNDQNQTNKEDGRTDGITRTFGKNSDSFSPKRSQVQQTPPKMTYLTNGGRRG